MVFLSVCFYLTEENFVFSNLSDLKKASYFYVFVMAINLTQILIFRAVAPESGAVVFTHMATPLLVTLFMLFIVTRDGYGQHGRFGLDFRPSGWRTWGLALLLPLLVLTVSYGLGWLSGAAALVVPTDGGGLPSFIINQLINLVVVTILVLSEEIGFRGYMLPRLLRLGSKRAVVLSGFAHATWHLPILLLTPFYEVQGNLYLIVPVFLLVLTAAGVVIGLLRLETDSIWPGTILHGAFNGFWNVFAELTLLSSPAAVYLVGESGVFTLLATAVVAFWFLRRLSPDTVIARQPMMAD
jgi:membrane protease YdiL (CAAX protease family)